MTDRIGTAGEAYPDVTTSMAFALQRNPGAYAVLLGAGISTESGVPTSWDVENELIRQVARIDGVYPEVPMEWFAERFGRPSRYDGLLSHLAHTQTERQGLLKNFFARTINEDETESFRPTEAHRALARLVAGGRIKVILTTNFDHLIEMALREINIEPVVVRQVSDLKGLAPLHMHDCLVVHLHGDFLTPVGLLNTTDELSTYPPKINRLLDRIFSEYGLIIVGWSAKWDTALRTALARNANRHFARYWIDNASLDEQGADLLKKCGGIFVKASADYALGRVADACDAIAATNPRGPFTVGSAVATAKRSLAGQRTAIPLHDSIATEISGLRECPVLKDPVFDAANLTEAYMPRLGTLEVAMAVPVSLVATTAYWGNTQTDRWWFEEIARFATWRPASGMTALIELLRIPAVTLLYAAGVAAVSSGRYDLVRRLLIEPTTVDNNGKTVRVSSDLTYAKVYAVSRPGRHLFDYLRPTFVEHLGVGYEAFRDSWERFEFLRLLENVYVSISERSQLGGLLSSRRALADVLGRESSMQTDVTTKKLWADLHAKVRKDYDSGLESHLGVAPVYGAFLRINGSYDRYHSPVAGQIRREVERDGQTSPLAVGGLCGGDAERLLAVLDVVDLALIRTAQLSVQRAWSAGTSIPPTPFWIDSPRDHQG